MSDYPDPGWPTMLTVAEDIANGMTDEAAYAKAALQLANKIDWEVYQEMCRRMASDDPPYGPTPKGLLQDE